MQCVHAVKSNLLQVRSFCGSSANRWMLMQQSLLQAVCSLRDSVCHGSLGSAWLSLAQLKMLDSDPLAG